MHCKSIRISCLILFFGAWPLLVWGDATGSGHVSSDKPNFLWLTIEDTSSYEFGCYGNTQVKTPHVDALASRGVLFTNVSSTAPQCSPARSTLISGSPATTYGTGFHRRRYPSSTTRPLYPTFLKQAGYFCINVNKGDYNIAPVPKDLWQKSKTYLDTPQPFFAVFNSSISHMTSVNNEARILAGAALPASDIDISHLPYLPDLPEIRANYAGHLKAVERVDTWIGKKLAELKASGKEEDTIIFFYSDHGGCQPRGKAFPYESGLRVPFIVYIPPKFEHLWPGVKMATKNDQLISFEDLAPTILSLAGIEPPASMQGNAFMGPHIQPPRIYQHGFRTNQGPHFDPIRTVSDGRFKYIRNYLPYKPLGLRQGYQWGMEANQAYDLAYLHGTLPPEHARFFEAKVPEELYDLNADPYEMQNLVDVPAHKPTLIKLRDAVSKHIRSSKDLGFISPHQREASEIPLYDRIHSSDFPLEELHSLVELSSLGNPADSKQLVPFLSSEHASMRYWAAAGFCNIGNNGHTLKIPDILFALCSDPDPDVAAVSALALCYHGETQKGMDVLWKLLAQEKWEALSCVEVYLKTTGDKNSIKPYLPQLKALAARQDGIGNYSPLFYFRSILVDYGINTPSDIFHHPKWALDEQN